MKIQLTIIICSLYANICQDPHTFTDKHYSNMYDCLLDGYHKSINKTEEIGRKEVNKHGIYTRFVCQEMPEIILPKPKPKPKVEVET